MAVPRKHHYLPQFYLRRFANPNESLWGFDKQAGSYFPTSVSDAGAKRDLYSTNKFDQATDHKTVEQRFSRQIEEPTAVLVDKVVKKETIALEEKRTLCQFLHSMHTRVLPRVKELEQRSSDLAQQTQLDALARIRPVSTDFPQEKHDELVRKAKEITEHLSSNLPKEALVPLASSKVIAVLMDMRFAFVEVASSFHFITCDDPVVYDKSTKLPICDFTFPLTSTIAIIGTRSESVDDLQYVRVSRSTGRDINFRTVANADRMIYSQKKSLWIGKHTKRQYVIDTQVRIR